MVNFLTNTFITLFQFIVRIFRRAVCCLRRRRRLSGEPVPLTNIGVVPNVDRLGGDSELQKWDSWEETPTIVTATKPMDPVQQQIELYRQQRMAASNPVEDEEQKFDYFQDMTPKILRQPKLLLQPKENEQLMNQTNFSLAPDPVFNSSELGVWEDSQSWEDQARQDWNAEDVLREKKRMERERRLAENQKKKFERSGRNLMATSSGESVSLND